MISIKATRPEVTYAETDWDYKPVIGAGPEWDWLFAELSGKFIASIKLIRQLNPGMALRDAKEAYEVMQAYRTHANR